MTTTVTPAPCPCGAGRFTQTQGPQNIELLCFCGRCQHFDATGRPYIAQPHLSAMALTERERGPNIGGPTGPTKPLPYLIITLKWFERANNRATIQWISGPLPTIDWEVRYEVKRNKGKQRETKPLRLTIHSIKALEPGPFLTDRNRRTLCQVLRQELQERFPATRVPPIYTTMIEVEDD